ncbi:MAG: hypothetical protein V1944_01120 [Candidatus Aenigmatarchaeota archaeon]
MSSQVDFIISAGIFLVFMATLLIFLSNSFISYTGLQITSEMRGAAFDIHNALFGGKGLPTNWENNNIPPRVFGLVTDMYRIPIILTEINNTARMNESINITVTFDLNCASRAWNNTVRVYDNDNILIPVALYNPTYCSEQFLNRSTIIFNTTLSPLQSKIFFVYFSDDKNVTRSTYSLSFNSTLNVTSKAMPEIKIPAISTAKLRALRNFNYNDFLQILGGSYNTYVEVSTQ